MVSSKSANDSTVDFGKRDRCSRLFGALGKTSVLRNQLCGTETVNDILIIYTLTPSAWLTVISVRAWLVDLGWHLVVISGKVVLYLNR